MIELVRPVVRATVEKVRGHSFMSMRAATVVRLDTAKGGHFPVVWVKVDGPDTEPVPAECPMNVPPIGQRVFVMFTPPQGLVALFFAGGHSSSGGGSAPP
jgi:hypothetical protein